MADQFSPTGVANQALDASGVDYTLGDIQSGVREAQVILRAYSECLRQLLRAAPWDFARKEAPLLLLADATGQTPNVGNFVGSGQFTYSYAYPSDCARIRYIPWCPFLNPGAPQNNIQLSDSIAPLMTGLGQAPLNGHRIQPSRFLVTSDQNNIPPGASNDIQGISPLGRTVVLSNVQNARCVYTYDATFPNVWDHQFRAAMVAYLASEISMPLSKDKKFGLAMRDRNIAIAQEKIKQARVSDGNEMTASSDIDVDWMRTRITGGRGWGGYGGGGDFGCWGGAGWAGSVTFGNGSSF